MSSGVWNMVFTYDCLPIAFMAYIGDLTRLGRKVVWWRVESGRAAVYLCPSTHLSFFFFFFLALLEKFGHAECRENMGGWLCCVSGFG